MIQRAGAHFDQNFVGFDFRIRPFSELQNFRSAVLFKDDRFHYFNSISTASKRVLPTFLIECVTAPARQRTSPTGSLMRSGLAVPSVKTSISLAVSATPRPDSRCVCMVVDSPGASERR